MSVMYTAVHICGHTYTRTRAHDSPTPNTFIAGPTIDWTRTARCIFLAVSVCCALMLFKLSLSIVLLCRHLKTVGNKLPTTWLRELELTTLKVFDCWGKWGWKRQQLPVLRPPCLFLPWSLLPSGESLVFIWCLATYTGKSIDFGQREYMSNECWLTSIRNTCVHAACGVAVYAPTAKREKQMALTGMTQRLPWLSWQVRVWSAYSMHVSAPVWEWMRVSQCVTQSAFASCWTDKCIAQHRWAQRLAMCLKSLQHG